MATATTIFDCSVMELSKIQNRSGSITPASIGSPLPFEIERVYYLYDVPGGESRGGHAHKQLQQLLVAASGSFEIILDDGANKRSIQLTRPYLGLYLPSMIWREIVNFSSGGICLVLASRVYDEEDYFRDYASYRDAKRSLSQMAAKPAS